MEVASEPAPLLLAGGDQLLPGALEFVADQDGLHQSPDLGAHVREQLPVARSRTGRGAASTSSCEPAEPAATGEQVDGDRRGRAASPIETLTVRFGPSSASMAA